MKRLLFSFVLACFLFIGIFSIIAGPHPVPDVSNVFLSNNELQLNPLFYDK